MRIESWSTDPILRQHFPQGNYLSKVDFRYPEAGAEFSIPRSSRVDAGEYLTAAEMLTCYSQLAHVFLDRAIQSRMIPEVHLSHASFAARKPEDLFVVRMEGENRSRIMPAYFRGIFRLCKTTVKSTAIFFNTTYEFNSGAARGEIDLALTYGR
jgi:hypothetical protein